MNAEAFHHSQLGRLSRGNIQSSTLYGYSIYKTEYFLRISASPLVTISHADSRSEKKLKLMANPTADWERVGGQYYRKVKLYDAVFDQDLELENYIIAASLYGGAIGTLDSTKQTIKASTKTIQLYIGTKKSFIHIELLSPPNQASTYTAVPAS